MRFHESLEIVEVDGRREVRCLRCGHGLGGADENYKRHAAYRERPLLQVPSRRLASGEPPLTVYQEFCCPGCGTLLEVDDLCPALEIPESAVVWDIRLGGVGATDPLPGERAEEMARHAPSRVGAQPSDVALSGASRPGSSAGRGPGAKLDPVQYEIFSHRLFHLLEEGQIAIRMVSGSPVVAEGGETMCAFYRE
ncbi:MAG: hypothetical protein HYY85_12680, partial [Deltaproteobacteria bacterium]|nr:hypothetical protein [Deltaproteobacteria bacterium]